MSFQGIHIQPDLSHPHWQPYSRGLDLLSIPSATSEDLLAVAHDCATASINSNAEDTLSIMAATLYLRAHTVAGPTSGEGSSGKFEMDKATFNPENVAEALYGSDRGKEEETIQRVISIFEFLNVEKFLKRHMSSERASPSSRATTPTQETTSSRATTPTQRTQGTQGM